MRIISGTKRGTRLIAPSGRATRPTPDRVREGVFNILSNRYRHNLMSPVVADVFAGSGALGLEAWSRSGGRVVFIENNPLAITALTANSAKLAADSVVVKHDATQPFIWREPPAGLIFLDPPWRKTADERDLAETAITNLIAMGAVADDALLCIEHNKAIAPIIPPNCIVLESRFWGRVGVRFLRYTP